MKVDGSEYMFDPYGEGDMKASKLKILNVEDTWVQYMKP